MMTINAINETLMNVKRIRSIVFNIEFSLVLLRVQYETFATHVITNVTNNEIQAGIKIPVFQYITVNTMVTIKEI